MSLAHALGLLGFRSLHFPQDDRTREEILGFLTTGGDRLRLSVLEKYDALTDTPICATFEALDAAYPGSKFVLTTREKEAWLESYRRFWAAWRLAPHLLRRPPGAAFLTAILEKLYGGVTFDRDRFSRAYDEYHERVRGHFRGRATDLVTLDICAGEGWDTLCGFLGVRRPRAEFPWRHRIPPSLSGDAAS
jgi:sulfotransferase family protein